MLSFVEIKNILTKTTTLPGKVSQYKMAPSNRDFLLQTTNTDNGKQSAVLVLIFNDNKIAKFVLIKRPEYDGPHSSQMALPGGKYEKQDKSLVQTAIRECYEEIGVKITKQDIALELTPLTIPKTGMNVSPFVAIIDYLPKFNTDKHEVAALYTPELNILFNKEIKKIYKNSNIIYPYYNIENQKVWGATAMILSELSDIIK